MSFSRFYLKAMNAISPVKARLAALRIPAPSSWNLKRRLSPLLAKIQNAAGAVKECLPSPQIPRISLRELKPKLSRLYARGLKEAALMRERIISLKDVTASFFDPKLMWVSGIVFVIFQGVLIWMLMRVDNPAEILRHQLQTNPDEFLVIRDNWGPEKVRFFLQHYWLDFIFPAVYAVFFRCVLTQVQLFYPTKFVYHSLAFPLAAAIYDEIENICQLALMAGWTESKFVFYAGAFGTYAKWLLLSATLAAVVSAFAQLWWERELEK